MKVTITEGLIVVEDGPSADPRLRDDDGQMLALLAAFQWAVASLMATAHRVRADQLALRHIEAAREQSAPRGGLH